MDLISILWNCTHSFTSVWSLKAIKQMYIQLRASMDTKDRKENQQHDLYKQKQNKTAHFKHFFSRYVSH